MSLFFVLNSLALGVGLAMDAFSVSLANGLHEPHMRRNRVCLIAGVFAFFQYLMPMIGWVCVHTIVEAFASFKKFIPWIALILLLYIGGKMLIEGLSERAGREESGGADRRVSGRDLVIQGVATSIDALSVGFTIAEYNFVLANAAAMIIGLGAAVSLILSEAKILDTVVHAMGIALNSVPAPLKAPVLFWMNLIINVSVPSGLGQAALVMPVFTPVAYS